MFGKENRENQCAALESQLVEYLDGRARPAVRHAVEEHLSGCAACRARAEEFRALWSAMDDLPALDPSPAFDASLRARIAAEPARRNFWDWLPSPRLAFAVTALIVMSVWLSSLPHTASKPAIEIRVAETVKAPVESDANLIRDLAVLENYDVVSKFDALSELPGPRGCASDGNDQREPVMKLRFQFGAALAADSGGRAPMRSGVRTEIEHGRTARRRRAAVGAASAPRAAPTSERAAAAGQSE